ncbi:MAG: transcriptional repressor [Ruminococcaceae bacterium]|nr:transcriptional repressor [Oscillospiraceae bacterium]
METVYKHSKQREAVKNLLKSVCCHPTAEWIYTELKKEHPNISLATVYRNLNVLCQMGEAVKIEVGDGTVRYDGMPENHYHFLCSECHDVMDVSRGELEGINKEIENKYNVTVDTHSIVFYGKCKKCAK